MPAKDKHDMRLKMAVERLVNVLLLLVLSFCLNACEAGIEKEIDVEDPEQLTLREDGGPSKYEEADFTPEINEDEGSSEYEEADFILEIDHLQTVKGIVSSLSLNDYCPVNSLIVTNQEGTEFHAPLADDCTFSISLKVGQQYIFSFADNRQNKATLIFDSGIGGFSTYWLFLNEEGSIVDLGEVSITDGVAMAERNPLSMTDHDGDTILDINDADEDGDGLVDVLEVDCDLDGIFHEGEDDLNCDSEADVGKVLEVKPRNYFKGAPSANLYRKVRVRFSCEIDRMTVTNETFKVISQDGSDIVDCFFKYSGTGDKGNKVICAHDEDPFLPGKTYNAVIDGVGCSDGTIVGKYLWSWKTKTPVEDNLNLSKEINTDVATTDVEDSFDDGNEIAFMVIGDQGSGDDNQKNVAMAMQTFCNSNDCDFVVTTGDNFFPYCVNNMGPDDPFGLTDPQWKTKYKDMYGALNIPFYPARGNHDCEAEFVYSRVDSLWRMAGDNYTVKIPENSEYPTVEFFFIYPFNFDVIENVVNGWLKDAIEASNAKWKILVTHSPLISNGTAHGDDEFGLNKLIVPIICNKIDLVLSAHDRIFSYLKDTLYGCPVEQIVIGTGGYSLNGLDNTDPRVVSGGKFHGFGFFEIEDNKSLKFKMMQTDDSLFYMTTWEKQ